MKSIFYFLIKVSVRYSTKWKRSNERRVKVQFIYRYFAILCARRSDRIRDLADPAASVSLLRFEKSKTADETDRRRQAFLLLLSCKVRKNKKKRNEIRNSKAYDPFATLKVESSSYGKYRDNFHRIRV